MKYYLCKNINPAINYKQIRNIIIFLYHRKDANDNLDI